MRDWRGREGRGEGGGGDWGGPKQAVIAYSVLAARPRPCPSPTCLPPLLRGAHVGRGDGALTNAAFSSPPRTVPTTRTTWCRGWPPRPGGHPRVLPGGGREGQARVKKTETGIVDSRWGQGRASSGASPLALWRCGRGKTTAAGPARRSNDTASNSMYSGTTVPPSSDSSEVSGLRICNALRANAGGQGFFSLIDQQPEQPGT